MKLKFLGKGAAYCKENNSAYFITKNNDLILIDCPTSSFHKIIKSENLKLYNNIYIIITHTHSDHIGGLSMLIFYLFYNLNKTVKIIAPTEELKNDIQTLLTIEGNKNNQYEILIENEVCTLRWYKKAILTKHVPELEGKCFGYNLNIDGTNVIYTGDTSIIDPFLDYIHVSSKTELYIEASAYKYDAHIYLKEQLENFQNMIKNGIDVYLMHIDYLDIVKDIVKDTKIKIVPTVDNID